MGEYTDAPVTGGGSARIQGRNCYGNRIAANKLNYKSNIFDLKDDVFTEGCPSDGAKYKDSVKVLINYFQQE